MEEEGETARETERETERETRRDVRRSMARRSRHDEGEGSLRRDPRNIMTATERAMTRRLGEADAIRTIHTLRRNQNRPPPQVPQVPQVPPRVIERVSEKRSGMDKNIEIRDQREKHFGEPEHPLQMAVWRAQSAIAEENAQNEEFAYQQAVQESKQGFYNPLSGKRVRYSQKEEGDVGFRPKKKAKGG